MVLALTVVELTVPVSIGSRVLTMLLLVESVADVVEDDEVTVVVDSTEVESLAEAVEERLTEVDDETIDWVSMGWL